MKDMACELVGDIVLCLHNAKAPDDGSWQVYVDACVASAGLHEGDFARTRQLVWTDGGGPNAPQRRAAVEAVENLKGAKEGRIAVVSSSTLVRGIVTVFNWFNFQVKAFSPGEIDMALSFLRVTPDEAARLWAAAERMAKLVNGGMPKAAIRPSVLGGSGLSAKKN